MTYANRLQSAIDAKQETHAGLAKKIGCSRQTVFLACTWAGEKERKLSAKLHSLAAKELGVDPAWLLDGFAAPPSAPDVSVEARSLDRVLQSVAQENRKAAYQEALQSLIGFLASPASSAPSPGAAQATPSATSQTVPSVGTLKQQ